LASPLRRTLLTSALVFEKEPVQIIAWPKLVEFYPAGVENQAKKMSEVKEDLEALPRHINLENIHENWWSRELSSNQDRLSEFLNWLALCPETRIAVVSHWGFIRGILLAANFHEDLSPRNCCPIVMHFGIPSIVKIYPEYRVQLLPAPQHYNNQQNPLLQQLTEFWEECRSHPDLQMATELGPLHITIIDYIPLPPEELLQVKKCLKSLSEKISLQMPKGFFVQAEEIDIKIGTDIALFIRLTIDSPQLKYISSELKQFPCCDNQGLRKEFTATILRDDQPELLSLPLRVFSPVLEKYPILDAMMKRADNPDWRKYFSEIVWKLCLESRDGEHMAFKLNNYT